MMIVIILPLSQTMDAAPSRKQTTHDRILETAATVLREAGFWGVGVADVMRRAGFMHGAFYAHFASRDALRCEAILHAGRDSAARMAQSTAQRQARGASPLRTLVDANLSGGHLVGAGCTVAALAGERPRQSNTVAQAASERVRGLVEAVRQVLPATAGDQAGVVAANWSGRCSWRPRAVGQPFPPAPVRQRV